MYIDSPLVLQYTKVPLQYSLTILWVVTRMDTSKSGWTSDVYYTMLYLTLRYTTLVRRIYWHENFWKSGEKTVVQGKELNTGFTVIRVKHCYKNG